MGLALSPAGSVGPESGVLSSTCVCIRVCIPEYDTHARGGRWARVSPVMEGGRGFWCLHLQSAFPPTLEEEPSLSSRCCQGNHFMNVHMVGTCACPAPHVSAWPRPQGPQP